MRFKYEWHPIKAAAADLDEKKFRGHALMHIPLPIYAKYVILP